MAASFIRRSMSSTSYRNNPLPVAVALVPVVRKGRHGLLAIRRSTADSAPGIALPGGYVDEGESWEEAACREVEEETGVKVAASDMELFDCRSTPDRRFILLFGRVRSGIAPLDWSSLPSFTAVPDEVEERLFVSKAELSENSAAMSFPLHVDAATRHFNEVEPLNVMADLCVVPMGVGLSVSEYVKECEKIFDAAGLEKQLHGYGTNIAGPWPRVMGAVKACHDKMHDMGAVRVSSSMRFGTRTDRAQSIRDKIISVEQKLQADNDGSGAQ